MQDKDFLSYFENLGRTSNPKEVVENSEKILTTLLTVEHQDPNKIEEFNSRLGHLVSEDLEYTINRLLHGTTSDEFPTKLAFGTPLLASLKTFKHIQPEKFIGFTDKEMDRNNAFSKGERSHFLASRLLAIYTLISSGKIDQLPNSLDIYGNLYNSFAQNMKEMPWAGQLALFNIEKSIEITSDKKVASKKLNLISKTFKSQLKSINSDFSIHIFGILLFLVTKQVEFGGEKENTLNDAIESILGEKKLLAKLILATLEIYPEKSLTLRYLGEYLARTKNPKQQEQFWTLLSEIMHDQSLKDKNPLYQFYFSVLTLLKYWVKDGKLSGKAFVKFTNTQIFQLWIKQTRVLNKSLHKVAKRIEQYLSKKIIDLLNQSGEMTAFQFLWKIKENKDYGFDTKNPMGRALLGSLTEEESIGYVNKLIEGFKHEKESFQFYLSELLVLFELNYQSISDKNVLKICQFLLETHLTFEFTGEVQGNEDEGITPEAAQKALTDGVREEAFVKLNSIIARLLKKSAKAYEGRKNPIWLGISSNGEIWTHRILKLLLKTGKDLNLSYIDAVKKTLQYLEDLQGEVQEYVKSSQQEAEEKEDEKYKKYLALILLISASALQLLSHQDMEENIDELIESARHIKERYDAEEEGDVTQKKRKIAGKKPKKLEKEDKNKPIDVIVDVMISMLTRCPGYLRDAIERTFAQFVDDIGDFAIGNLVGVVIRNDQEYLQDMKEDETNGLAGMIEEEEDEDNGDKIEEETD